MWTIQWKCDIQKEHITFTYRTCWAKCSWSPLINVVSIGPAWHLGGGEWRVISASSSWVLLVLVDKLSSGFARVWWFSSPGWQKVFSLVLQALEWLDLTDPCLNQHCPSVALIMRHSPDLDILKKLFLGKFCCLLSRVPGCYGCWRRWGRGRQGKKEAEEVQAKSVEHWKLDRVVWNKHLIHISSRTYMAIFLRILPRWRVSGT